MEKIKNFFAVVAAICGLIYENVKGVPLFGPPKENKKNESNSNAEKTLCQ